MPRIPDEIANCVAFLYLSEADAEEGAAAGGTAFFVSVKTTDGREAILAVTNIHLAAGGCNALRVVDLIGESRVLRVPEWIYHPEADDVAVAEIDLPKDVAVSAIAWDGVAATDERMAELNVGVGDEVIMIGRFGAHDGGQRNAPLARFGNIAMMPGEPVLDGRKMTVEANLVEMRSLSGFSGSPVFIHIGPTSYRANGKMMPFFTLTIGLIGIDTGHKTNKAKVLDGAGAETDLTAEQNTGIAIVCPVRKIAAAIEHALDAEIIWGPWAEPGAQPGAH